MTRLTFKQMVEQCRESVNEIMPWDLAEQIAEHQEMIILDVREKDEFTAMHIAHSLHIPRGILETSCEFGFEETHPVLANSRNKYIVVVCRSGNRSLLAAKTMQLLGYENVVSLQTGLRGWNDYEQPLVDMQSQQIDIDDADDFFTARLTPLQKGNSE